MSPSVSLSDIPAGLLAGLVIVAVIQVTLDVIALIDLARRPREQVQFGRKWPWVLIIVAVNLIGAIAYLGAGRRPAPAPEPSGATSSGRGPLAPETVADSLYGQREENR